MRYAVLLLLIILAAACDTSAQNVKEEINAQVWSPFITSYSELDADGFMEVHTRDIIRVNRDGGEIRIGREYADAMRSSSERNKQLGTMRSISFSFLERIHSDNYAFEVGYYKVLSATGGLQHVSYGKFHVVLKKTKGKWKILVDSDTSLNNSITEEDFLQGEVMVK